MFFTIGGFNHPPTSWQQLFTVDAGIQKGEVILLNGNKGELELTIRGVSEAFYLEPKSDEPISIIGVMSSKYFAKNDPRAIPSSNWDSSRWIKYNGSAVWHKMHPQTELESTLAFYNQDDSEELFSFSAQCQNVPLGSRVRLYNSDLETSFDSGFQVINDPNQLIEVSALVPSYYQGQLSVYIEDPAGKLLPASAAVDLSMNWRLNPNHKHYARLQASSDIASARLDDKLGALLNLGEYRITGAQ